MTASRRRCDCTLNGAMPRALLLLAPLLFFSFGCASIQQGGRRGLEATVRTESTVGEQATMSPSKSIGFEGTWRQGKVNMLFGPDERFSYLDLRGVDAPDKVLDKTLMAPSAKQGGQLDGEQRARLEKLREFELKQAKPSLGLGFGFFGGYTNLDGGIAGTNERMTVEEIFRIGALGSLIGTNSASFSHEWISFDLSLRTGLSLVSRWVRTSPDTVEGTTAPYFVAAPVVTIFTPLRLKVGDWTWAVLTVGGESAFYFGDYDDFITGGLRLGVFFIDTSLVWEKLLL